MAVNEFKGAISVSTSESPSFSKGALASALRLEYPSNPKQINTAVLVLEYLLSKGMTQVSHLLTNSTIQNFYIDEFAQQIWLLRYSNTVDVYKSSKIIEPRKDNKIDETLPILLDNASKKEIKDANKAIMAQQALKEIQQKPEYSLGSNPRNDIIEYKIRKELLTLIDNNKDRIQMMERSIQENRSVRSPFRWITDKKTSPGNILLGGKTRADKFRNISDNMINKFGERVSRINNLPAEVDRSATSRG